MGPRHAPGAAATAKQLLLCTTLPLLLLALPAVAQPANLPAAPDNIFVFPDRDFVSIEGYTARAGESATVEVRRGGVVVGQSTGTISGTDVAFEVNHPGGVCWGRLAPQELQVTPDIVPGDIIRLNFQDGSFNEILTLNASAQLVNYVDGATTFTVTGIIGPEVDEANIEQRIVNPALTTTAVGRRDIRAAPGPLAPGRGGAYSSSLVFDRTAGTFTATYVFTDATIARTAATGGGARVLAWQFTDVVGNAQGVSIAELGEVGGPGFGGCPPGPTQVQPAPGTAVAFRRASDNTTISVSFTAPTPVPGSQPITGFSILAISPADRGTCACEADVIGRRVPTSVSNVIIGNLQADVPYTVEVRTLVGNALSLPFIVNVPVLSPGDTTAPALTATPPPSGQPNVTVTATSVTLSTDDPNATIFFTTNGETAFDPLQTDVPNPNATVLPSGGTIPVPVNGVLNLRAAAFDPSGNRGDFVGLYVQPVMQVPPPPAAVTGLTATAGQAQVSVSWVAPAGTVDSYTVQARQGSATLEPPTMVITGITGTSTIVRNLTPGTQYFFTVIAVNAGGPGAVGPPASATPTTPTDVLTLGSGTWRFGEVRVRGAGSIVGATLSLRRGTATGVVLGTTTVAVGGAFDLRVRATTVNQNPSPVFITSSAGGVLGPITLTAARRMARAVNA